MARGASEPTNDAEDAALRYWLGPKQKDHDDEPISDEITASNLDEWLGKN